MSYQVLARKWRPQNFKQMVGQEHVLKALIHALDSQRLHHAYLFTGTRGVGKTTIGRILAKCLSCHKGITSEPCGTCGACLNIVEGRYVDLIEIDAASRTKVEDMRELLENVQYAPSEGRFKIYLIDEVHMLSQSSFNALLKTLEEPPEHVKFLFATTDPQKLPVTILSRCLQFNLKNMSPERIVGHLKYVLTEEKVQFEDPALWALARAADGSMRDALSLTDQGIAYGNHNLSESGVSAMLGTVDQKKVYRILDRLVNRDAAAMLKEVSELAEFSPDYKSVLATLSEVLHRVAIEQAVPGACDNSMGDQEQVVSYAAKLCAEDVQLFYQIALVSRQDLSITPDSKSGFEMALLRMMAFQLSPTPMAPEEGREDLPVSDVQQLNQQASEQAVAKPVSSAIGASNTDVSNTDVSNALDGAIERETVSYEEIPNEAEAVVGHLSAENDDSALHRIEPSIEPSPSNSQLSELEDSVQEMKKKTVLAELSPAVDASEEEAPKVLVTDGSFVLSEDVNTEQHIHAEPPHLVSPPEVEGASAPVEPIEIKASTTNTDENSSKSNLVEKTQTDDWNNQVTLLGLSGMTLNLLLNAVLEKTEASLYLCFDSGHFRLLNTNHEKRIKEALLAYFDQYSHVEFTNGLKAGDETPMMWRERKRAEMHVEAKRSIESDPYVLQMLSDFDAVLIDESIKALS